jgi:hypothetical protein
MEEVPDFPDLFSGKAVFRSLKSLEDVIGDGVSDAGAEEGGRDGLTYLTASTVPRNLGHDRSIYAIRVHVFDSLAQRCVYDRILGVPVSGIQ